MKRLFLVFVFAILFVSSVGFVGAAVPKQDAIVENDKYCIEMVNLTTSARKLNFADPVNSARPIITSADMPTNLANGAIVTSSGVSYKYTQSVSPGWTISEFGTSEGDIANPVLYYQVGTDAYLPLYTYTVTFNNSIAGSDFSKLVGKKIKILGLDYTIVNISDNRLVLSGQGKTFEIVDRSPVYVEDGSGSRVAIPGTTSRVWLQNGLPAHFAIGFAMQSSQRDHVAMGESFLNPVFGRLSFVFDNANPNLNDASRAMVKVRTDNNQYSYVTFNSARSGTTGSKELTYVYDSNTNSTGVAPILAHQTVSTNGKGIIQIQEGGAVKQNDWMVINQGDAGTILEVTDMSIDSATSGKITFQDVITGESQTITLTNLTGQGYIKTGVNFYGGSGYTIKMDQNGVVANVFWNNATRAIFPRIALKNGGWIAFLTAAKVSSTESLILPNGRLTLPTTGKQFGSIAINQRKSLFVDGVNWTGISQSSGTITIDRISNYELGSNATGIGGRITTDKGNIIEVTDLTVDSATTGKATFQDVITGETSVITLTNVSGYYQKSGVRIFGGVYTVRMNQAGTQVSLVWTTGASCDFGYNKGPAILLFEPKKWNDASYGDYVCIPLTTTGITEIAIGDPAIGGINSGYTTLQSDTYQKQAVDMYGSFFQKEDRTNENGVATIKYPASQMYFNALLTAPCASPKAIRLAPETCAGFSGWIKKLFGKC